MKHQKFLVFLITMLPVIITSCSNDDEDYGTLNSI